MEINEKRTFTRYKVKGARVLFSQDENTIVEAPLVDISEKALCFKTNASFKESEPITIELIIPEIKNILIRGLVVRTAQNIPENHICVAIWYVQIGYDSAKSSTESYKLIKEVLQKCQPLPINFKSIENAE